MPTPPEELRELEREAYRIVGMICRENVATDSLDTSIESLRARTANTFPDRPQLFDQTYGRRFKRLRTQFRPRANLLS